MWWVSRRVGGKGGFIYFKTEVIEELCSWGQVDCRYQASSKSAWWLVLTIPEIKLIYCTF